MEHDEEFSRLEEFVEKLLAGYNTLQAECDGLRASLVAVQQENERLTDTVAGQQEDRNDLHSRVSGLISKIEAWERSGRSEAGRESDTDAEVHPASPSVEQANMFAMHSKSDHESTS